MIGWGGRLASIAAGCCLVAACGEIEKKKNDAREAIVEEVVMQTLDDDSTFTGTVKGSPLELKKFEGKVSIFNDGTSKNFGKKIEIKSGSSTLNLAPDAINILQGVSIAIYGWTGETEIPVANPKEPPDEGPFAVVAYSEVQRDNMDVDGNHDWYTYRSTEGVVNLKIVDTGDDGGAKGTVSFSVLLTDPNRPPKSIDDLPLVTFEGTFNVRRSTASTLYTGK